MVKIHLAISRYLNVTNKKCHWPWNSEKNLLAPFHLFLNFYKRFSFTPSEISLKPSTLMRCLLTLVKCLLAFPTLRGQERALDRVTFHQRTTLLLFFFVPQRSSESQRLQLSVAVTGQLPERFIVSSREAAWKGFNSTRWSGWRVDELDKKYVIGLSVNES